MSLSAQEKNNLFWVFGIATLVLWVCSFWAFLSRDVQMVSDAVSFYEHLKFYIDNISLGVYPLWDPSWSCGSPNDFFLRRIGPFNPFLLLILILYKLGVSYWSAFAFFITFYFFLGMGGFYKLALEIFKNKPAAVVAFVLLSFSSISTKVFDSYLVMVFTPMIWFFYLGFVFGRSGQRSAFVAMVFCAMLLMTTYIPFYFIVAVLSFSVFFVFIFPREALNFVGRFGNFVGQNPWLFILCALALVLSCAPGIAFFQSAQQGHFAMPLRHFNAVDPHVLSVKTQVTAYWAIPEELLYSSFYWQDLRQFDFAVFYVPLFAMVLFCLGTVTALNRRMLLMFLWGFFLLVLGSPYFMTVYDFLLKNIFFFKYFRNLHFFLWLIILPVFILFVIEQMRLFLRMVDKNPQRKILAFIFILAVHAGFAVFFVWQGSFNFSTWASWAVSLIFFILYLYTRLSMWTFCGLCFVAVVLQPLEAYHFLQHNAFKTVSLLAYDTFVPQFKYTRWDKALLNSVKTDKPVDKSDPLYFGTQWYNWLWDHMDPNILKKYTLFKFVVYDRVAVFDEQKQDLKIIEEAWDKNSNIAFVAPDTPAQELNVAPQVFSSNALPIEQKSPSLKVTDFNVNRIKFQTNFSTKKFLVFNDCYYPNWRAYINGKEVLLIRANVAFKGLWIDRGEQEVEFDFAKSACCGLEPFLAVFYLCFLAFLLWLWRRDLGTSGV